MEKWKVFRKLTFRRKKIKLISIKLSMLSLNKVSSSVIFISFVPFLKSKPSNIILCIIHTYFLNRSITHLIWLPLIEIIYIINTWLGRIKLGDCQFPILIIPNLTISIYYPYLPYLSLFICIKDCFYRFILWRLHTCSVKCPVWNAFQLYLEILKKEKKIWYFFYFTIKEMTAL